MNLISVLNNSYSTGFLTYLTVKIKERLKLENMFDLARELINWNLKITLISFLGELRTIQKDIKKKMSVVLTHCHKSLVKSSEK